MSPGPAAFLLAAAGSAALLAERVWTVAALATVLLAVPVVGPGRGAPVGGADGGRGRAARCDHDRGGGGGAQCPAADGALPRVRRLRAPARPRPARCGGRRCAEVGAGGGAPGPGPGLPPAG